MGKEIACTEESKEHCHQHLEILGLVEQERNEDAARAMREHLASTLRNMEKIRGILKP